MPHTSSESTTAIKTSSSYASERTVCTIPPTKKMNMTSSFTNLATIYTISHPSVIETHNYAGHWPVTYPPLSMTHAAKESYYLIASKKYFGFFFHIMLKFTPNFHKWKFPQVMNSMLMFYNFTFHNLNTCNVGAHFAMCNTHQPSPQNSINMH